MLQKIVSPSILSADFLNLNKEIKELECSGADWHHLDVMDGHFVPNLTFGPPLIKQIKSIADCPLDVHLMISNPASVIDDYIKAGADYLTFHVEACEDSLALIRKIKSANIKAGLSIKPKTELSVLKPFLLELDLILVMSVEPGFGGQKFIEGSLKRVQEIKQMLIDCGRDKTVLISVDGGVNYNNAKDLRLKGADCLVAGSYVYGAENREKAIISLKE